MEECICGHPHEDHEGSFCKGTVDDGVIRYGCHCDGYRENSNCARCRCPRYRHMDRAAAQPGACYSTSCRIHCRQFEFRRGKMDHEINAVAPPPAPPTPSPPQPKEVPKTDDKLLDDVAERFRLLELD